MTRSDNMTIGENIKRLREERKWSQRELANRVYVTDSYICSIEKNQKMVSVPLLVNLARAFHCKLDDLVPVNDEN